MATYPALAVEFAPGIAASAEPTGGDWVDITTRVQSFSLKWGREDEFSQPGAGTCELVLDNADGDFDPDNTSGPYYGDLLPLVWFRILGGTTTATSDVFYGQVSIDGWRLSASQFPGSVDVAVTLVDAVEQWANTDLPGSVWEIEVKADAPKAWYRLGESSGSVMFDSSGNAHHGTYEGGVTFNNRASLVDFDENGALAFDGVDDVGVAPISAGFTVAEWSVEMWISMGEVDTDDQVLWEQQASTSDDYFLLAVSGTNSPDPGELFVQVKVNGTTDLSVGTVRVDDGEAHHLVLTWSDAGVAKVYVDTTLDINDDLTAASSYTHTPAKVMLAYGDAHVGGATLSGTRRFTGTMDEVAFYDSELASARVDAHYAAATAPWEGDLTGARAERLLDAASWPATLRNIDTGETTMPPADLGGDDLQSSLQETATGEGGVVYVDHQDAGNARFEDRYSRLTLARSTTSQATFGDGGGTEVPYSSVELADDRIINSATLSRSGGSAITVSDATSQATYQERDYSESGLLTTSDAEVASRAATLVAAKKDRHRRVRSVVLEPRKSTHLAWAQVFARRISDRVTVKWRPPYGGTYTYTCWIIGVAHDWVQRDSAWRTTFWLEPVPHDTTGSPYWILGTSTLQTGASTTRLGW